MDTWHESKCKLSMLKYALVTRPCVSQVNELILIQENLNKLNRPLLLHVNRPRQLNVKEYKFLIMVCLFYVTTESLSQVFQMKMLHTCRYIFSMYIQQVKKINLPAKKL